MTLPDLLYDIICDQLCQDKPIDSSHRSFLANAWGLHSDSEIREFLISEPQEAISFYDLLCFPDEAFQVKIEPLFISDTISMADQSYLIDRLSTSRLTTNILFEKNCQNFNWQIDPMMISTFVSRLNLTQRISQNIRNIFVKRDSRQWPLYVLLRNKNIKWTDESCEFIERIIQTFLGDNDLSKILIHMLEFCAECGHQGDFLNQLKKRKRQLVQNLHRYKHSQDLHEKHSMEFLVSSGIRPVHVNVEDTNTAILFIDRVLKDVFGKIEYILPEDYAVIDQNKYRFS